MADDSYGEGTDGDGAADDYPGSAMICLLPIVSDWCKIKLPHMTLVYVGKIADLKSTVFNELAKQAADLAAISRPLTIRTIGVEPFGNWGDGEVDVIRLQLTPELAGMRRIVEDWNASEYKDFKPHCTMGPRGTAATVEVPGMIAFDRVAVGWGKDLIEFSMQGRG